MIMEKILFTSPRSLARSCVPSRALRHAPTVPRNHRIAISTAAPPQQRACPLDDDDEDEADRNASSSSSLFSTSSSSLPLLGRRVLITAPRAYAASLGSRLLARGARVLSVPGVRTVRLKRGSGEERELDDALKELLGILPRPSPSYSSSSPPFAAVAFTSRAGIEACLERIAVLVSSSSSSSFPSPSCSSREEVLAAGGAALASAAGGGAGGSDKKGSFLLWALGADADALVSAGVAPQLIMTPPEASTTGMVNAMASFSTSPLLSSSSSSSSSASSSPSSSSSFYSGKRILCPVPTVVGGLTEPPVVPRFLVGLSDVVGAIPVRVPSYATAPAADVVVVGASSSADGVIAPSAAIELSLLSAGRVDAVVFSSTAEAQGLDLAAGGGLVRMIERGNEERRRRRRSKTTSENSESGSESGSGSGSESSDIVLAAHGPYTAAGVTRVLSDSNPEASAACTTVTVVPEDFSTFAGVVEALEVEFRRRHKLNF